MPVYPFALRFSPGNSFVFLRELNGHDELLVNGTGILGVLNLLNNIMVQIPYASHANITDAGKIVVTDRDRLLCGIYKYTFGEQIESSISCTACSSRYDLRFSLNDLEKHYLETTGAAKMDSEGYFNTAGKLRFRPPTGEDELHTWGLSVPDAEFLLLQRCVSSVVSQDQSTFIQQSMEEVAPVLDTVMQTACPECGHRQEVEFDIQSFLLGRIMNERRRVATEVCCLAANYRWSHKEILDLPRSLRKTYAQLAGLN